MTLDTLIETGKILSYSEGESYVAVGGGWLITTYSTTVIRRTPKGRVTNIFTGTTRKDVTKQVIKYFS